MLDTQTEYLNLASVQQQPFLEPKKEFLLHQHSNREPPCAHPTALCTITYNSTRLAHFTQTALKRGMQDAMIIQKKCSSLLTQQHQSASQHNSCYLIMICRCSILFIHIFFLPPLFATSAF